MLEIFIKFCRGVPLFRKTVSCAGVCMCVRGYVRMRLCAGLALDCHVFCVCITIRLHHHFSLEYTATMLVERVASEFSL